MRTVGDSATDDQTLTSSNGAEPNEMADPANAPLKPNISVLGFLKNDPGLTLYLPIMRYR